MTPERNAGRTLNRRDLLRGGAGLFVVATASGCGFFDTDPAGEESSSGAKGKEAPSLRERVERGELPPVEERLPDSPLVVEPLERTGVYGGTWHSAMLTQEDVSWLRYTLGYEPLVRWAPHWEGSAATEILPNVCESYEVVDGGKEYVFTLRRGLKWSDGEPVTADDFDFAFNDYNIYSELHPDSIYALWLSQSGEPARFEKVDDHTVRYVYEEPKAGFLEQIAGTSGVVMCLPKHYLRQFHAKYNDDAEGVAQDAGMNRWVDHIVVQADPWANPELPTLNAWLAQNEVGEGPSVIAERNPYYWKVDPDGSQLPYIEKMVCEVVQDVEVEVLKVSNGDLDMQLYHFGTIRNKPVVAASQEEGGYELIDFVPSTVNTMVIGFNQTHPDAARREVFANKDFRIGLSHAINRQKIIDTLFGGQGHPWQCAPIPGSDLHDAEMGEQYTAYDVDLANDYLDRAGYTERNGDGIRLREDGGAISFNVLVVSDYADQVDALDLIRADWREVGVEVTIQRMAETLYWERVEAGEAEASTWTGGPFDIRTGAGGNHYYLPSNPRGSSRFASEWAKWYTRPGRDGTEPPERIRQQLELFDEMLVTFDAAEATALARQILEITKEEFFYIGISTPPTEYGVVKTSFHNVPDSFTGSVAYQAPGPSNPEQYFISDEA
ncbi:ABC transporter substrate-binding protein [Streptomyces johnsoniae]|uniref:ABC transporter substrate-binding protein n=1 Tax=Streptomyces johnsoniae TaxID=3075532 RepID=A0ABU2SAM9_9ACTN|nr:ABC transporter substrate-binding protein [Streptomyces sp. DSM 41886]MDT0444735.1 ABC transporter substrate-binding protein [Streptomyces sp. DSM 41886]